MGRGQGAGPWLSAWWKLPSSYALRCLLPSPSEGLLWFSPHTLVSQLLLAPILGEEAGRLSSPYLPTACLMWGLERWSPGCPGSGGHLGAVVIWLAQQSPAQCLHLPGNHCELCPPPPPRQDLPSPAVTAKHNCRPGETSGGGQDALLPREREAGLLSSPPASLRPGR